MATTVERYVAWLIEFPSWPNAVEQYFWTGEGDLSFDSKTWRGTTYDGIATVQASPIQNVRQGAPSRVVVNIAVGTPLDTIRHQIVSKDPGPIAVIIRMIYRNSPSDAWTELARKRIGRLSNPTFINGMWSYEIESYSGDIDRYAPKRWSHPDQIAEHPGDMFFEFAAGYESGTDVKWPP